jgi:O-succinylhomoserine sulfhydrylase
MTERRSTTPAPAVLARCRAETRLVHGGGLRSQFDETSEALYLTSGYVYSSAAQAEAAFEGSEDHDVYSRFSNPTLRMFEERLRLLEGAECCRSTATGMAAVFGAIAPLVKQGDRVVAARALFGSCRHILANILPRWGVEVVFVDGTDLAAWAAALATPAALVFLETPANPTLDLVDLAAVADLAHGAGAVVVVDNAFATPILQTPLDLGCDIVTYSATKYMDGQGRCLGGAILGSDKLVGEVIHPFLRNTGPTLSPFNAWVMLKGLETLPLRMDRHCATAQRVAETLAGRGDLHAVRYPGLPGHPQHDLARRQMRGFGGIVAFDLADKAAAFRFLDALALVRISNNLGDSKTLCCHPWTTTHQKVTPEDKRLQGIGEGTLRLSVGLEAAEDVIADLTQALDRL